MSETKKLRKVPTVAFRRQLLTVFPVFLNTFMTGGKSGWISNAIYFFNKGDPALFTSLECSVIASSSEIGCTIFSLPAGYLADQIGRKEMMTIAAIVHSVGWIMLSYFSSYTSIIIARFILGIGSALVSSASLITVGEIVSPEIRAKVTSINQLFFYLGQIFPSLLNIFFSSYHFISYTLTIISVIYFPSLYWLIETPQFYVSRSKHAEAKSNLKIIRTGYSDHDIDEEFENFKKYITDEQTRKKELNWFKFLTSRKILKPLTITVIVHYLVQGIGSFVIMTYVTKIVPETEFIPIRYYPCIVQFMRISSSALIPFYIELFPRRVAFLGSILFALFNLVLIGTSFFCLIEYSIHFCQWIIMGCILLGSGIETSFIHTATGTMRGELLPQAVKGVGGSICVMALSAANAVGFLVYRFVTENYDMYWIFFVFAFNGLVLFFIIYLFLPETRGQFLADIQVKRCQEVDDGKESAQI